MMGPPVLALQTNRHPITDKKESILSGEYIVLFRCQSYRKQDLCFYKKIQVLLIYFPRQQPYCASPLANGIGFICQIANCEIVEYLTLLCRLGPVTH